MAFGEIAVALAGDVLVLEGDGGRPDLQDGAVEKHEDQLEGVGGGNAGFDALLRCRRQRRDGPRGQTTCKLFGLGLAHGHAVSEKANCC